MNLDPAKQQRIEIATRLMEAWLRGKVASNDPEVVQRKAAEFAKAANIIQQEAA